VPVPSRLPRRPDLVFLDLGDTLVRPDPSWAGVYIAALGDCGIRISPAELERAFTAAMASDHWSFEGPFEATEAASWARIIAFDQLVLTELGHPDQPEEVFRAIERRFQTGASWHVFPDVPPALDALKAAGLRLAVISNWVWGAPELLHDLELAAHFEALIISARVGFQKPHEGIFRHALEVTGIDPERAVHVGDQYRADILGSRAVGITGILLDRTGRDLDALKVPPDEQASIPFIRDLDGLLELLDVGVPAAGRAS
jgi:putative hydrolase of the HAD superfamily